jgi:hypothetical protein
MERGVPVSLLLCKKIYRYETRETLQQAAAKFAEKPNRIPI